METGGQSYNERRCSRPQRLSVHGGIKWAVHSSTNMSIRPTAHVWGILCLLAGKKSLLPAHVWGILCFFISGKKSLLSELGRVPQQSLFEKRESNV